MNRRAKRLYDLAPNGAQTVALNALGLWQRRRWAAAGRLGQRLSITERWSREQQRAYVDRRLRVVLLHAVELSLRTVPFGDLNATWKTRAVTSSPFWRSSPSLRAPTLPSGLQSTCHRLSGRTVFASTRRLEQQVPRFTYGWSPPSSASTTDSFGAVTCGPATVGADWIARLVGDPVVPLERSGRVSPRPGDTAGANRSTRRSQP